MTRQAPRIAWISADDPPNAFPPLELAFTEPDGLLAAGGDLSGDRLLYAYRHGIFPWYEEGQPILWWSPNPRCILIPQEFHLARRAKRALKSACFELSFNSAFDDVMAACAAPRDGQPGTWITADMKNAYSALHRDGFAHSVEIWRGDLLVGGLYGLAIGSVFFGESMFSRNPEASKAALLALCSQLQAQNFDLLDCQVLSPHLTTLGAKTLPRPDFAALLQKSCESGTRLTLPGEIRHPINDYLPKTGTQ
jgi:leucyl/phenylalanyl-tRNA--protein transferase